MGCVGNTALKIGSSGRTRTYNPSVNSRTAYSRLTLQPQNLEVRNFDFLGNWGDFGGTPRDLELRSRELTSIKDRMRSSTPSSQIADSEEPDGASGERLCCGGKF